MAVAGGAVGLAVKPSAGAVAVRPDGRRLLVANFQNDSVSVIDLSTGTIAEADLRPGAIAAASSGLPGGSFPRAVVWSGPTRPSSPPTPEILVQVRNEPPVRFALAHKCATFVRLSPLINRRITGELYAATQ